MKYVGDNTQKKHIAFFGGISAIIFVVLTRRRDFFFSNYVPHLEKSRLRVKTTKKWPKSQKKNGYVFFLCVISNILQFQVHRPSLDREIAIFRFFRFHVHCLKLRK